VATNHQLSSYSFDAFLLLVEVYDFNSCRLNLNHELCPASMRVNAGLRIIILPPPSSSILPLLPAFGS
jgi:hypothetical protein